jgi:hypothetical protein
MVPINPKVLGVHWYFRYYQFGSKYRHVFGMCDARQGMNWILDLLTQLVNTNNYDIITISTLYNSLLHTLVSSVYYSLY